VLLSFVALYSPINTQAILSFVALYSPINTQAILSSVALYSPINTQAILYFQSLAPMGAKGKKNLCTKFFNSHTLNVDILFGRFVVIRIRGWYIVQKYLALLVSG
jgi:hypothetical protein